MLEKRAEFKSIKIKYIKKKNRKEIHQMVNGGYLYILRFLIWLCVTLTILKLI